MQRFDNPDVIITDVLSSHGKWRADKPAIICGDTRLTWREFNSRINQVANGLIGLGLQKGDKVSLLMSNRPEMLEILFGAIRAGGVIVPLSVMVPGNPRPGWWWTLTLASCSWIPIAARSWNLSLTSSRR